MKRVIAAEKSPVDFDSKKAADRLGLSSKEVSFLDYSVQEFYDYVKDIAEYVESITGVSMSSDPVVISSEYSSTGDEKSLTVTCEFDEIQDYFVKAIHRMFEDYMESGSANVEVASGREKLVRRQTSDETRSFMDYTISVSR